MWRQDTALRHRFLGGSKQRQPPGVHEVPIFLAVAISTTSSLSYKTNTQLSTLTNSNGSQRLRRSPDHRCHPLPSGRSCFHRWMLLRPPRQHSPDLGHIHAFWLIYRKMKAEERYGVGGYRYVGNGDYQPVYGAPQPQQPVNYGATA